VAATAYDEEYYTTCCAGAHEWSHSGGRDVAGIYKWALTTAGFAPGETLLDIGTGRGELVALAAERGARWALGVEYSADATALCRKTFEAHDVTATAHAVLADARQLPVSDGSVDVVMMLDVVEHLTAAELDHCLREVRRCLSRDGRLFVHTFPTSTVYNVTYRAQRNLVPWRRRTWPANPRTAAEQSMHVNEQTPARLARALRAAGLKPATVRLGEWVYCDFVPSDAARRTYARLARHRLTARFGIANLWAVARVEPGAT
jgi:cyclopropane fatty-acyl-phospholipid synthase-like methyltransferase